MSAGKKPAVLLTGAGGAAIPGLIDHLRESGYRVLAADMDPQAIGLFLADKGFVIPGGASPDFSPVVENICREESVEAFLPLVDEELVKAADLERPGLSVILPVKKFVETCLDKLKLMEALQAAGIPVPRSYPFSGTPPLDFPFVLKPRTGRGSRGVRIIRTPEEWEQALEEGCGPSYMIQELVQGTEFTVSVVAWRDGSLQAVVPKEIVSKRGITRMAVTRKNTRIRELAGSVLSGLDARGPFNMQLILENGTGRPLLFEINPRFSTSVSLTMAAGVDEVGMLLAQALSGRAPLKVENWKENLFLLRTTRDRFCDESEIREPLRPGGLP